MKYLFLLISFFYITPAFSKITIEDKCRNSPFKVQQKVKACQPYIASFYKTRDPIFDEKQNSAYVFKVKIQEGSVKGMEGAIGYDFDPFEFGISAGTIETLESSSVGKLKGQILSPYFQYNFLKRKVALEKKYNAFMVLKFGYSNLDIYDLEENFNYPYLGMGAGGVYYLNKNVGISAGVDLHQIVHSEKNLFHLGSSFNLGLEFKF